MKKRRYGITGFDEKCINKWSDLINNDLRIFSHSHWGNRDIIIVIKLTKIEVLKIKTYLFMYNLKNKTNIKIVSLK